MLLSFKVGLSPSKDLLLLFVSPSKMMKSAFYFILKAIQIFVLTY